MNDIERIMIETVSYALDFKETVLFCRMCGNITTDAADVQNRYCGHCLLWHDNLALERWIAEQTNGEGSTQP